jgi:hypothetical protein
VALLHIFDANDESIRQTAEKRGVLTREPVTSVAGMVGALDKIRMSGTRFDRCLFETHGTPGSIWFGEEALTSEYIEKYLTTRYWDQIFQPNSRIYFNGCNVAEGQDGSRFLRAAASSFIKSFGGTVFGQTSLGFPNPFNGHVIHLWGDTKTLYVEPGGRIVEATEQ